MKNKNSCLYCHGFTTDDARGNCSACGAPRLNSDGREINQAVAGAKFTGTVMNHGGIATVKNGTPQFLIDACGAFASMGVSMAEASASMRQLQAAINGLDTRAGTISVYVEGANG